MILFLIYFKAFGVPALQNRAGITEAGLWGTHLGGCVRVSPPGSCDIRGGLSWNWKSWGGSCPGSAVQRPFLRSFGGFWRVLALEVVCGLSGEGAGGRLQGTVRVSPLCPLVCPPGSG